MKGETPDPANDNTHLKVISDPISRSEMSRRVEALLDEFATDGVADMALVNVLFEAMCDTLSAHHWASRDNPCSAHAMGRYNQISRLSGVLEMMSAEAREDWVERLCRFE